MPNPKLQDATKTQLSPRQLRALEALVSQRKGESFQSVADRAGVHRCTLYRFMSDPIFYAALNQRIRDEFRLVRVQVTRSLFRNAMSGDVQSQRLYFQLSGLLSETIEFTTNPQNIETIPTIDPDKLTPETRQALWAAIQEVKSENPDLSGADNSDNSLTIANNGSVSRFTLADPTQKASFSGGIEDAGNIFDNGLDGIDSALSASSGPNSGPNYRPNLDLFDDDAGETPGTPAEATTDDFEEF